jgi:hypothetical protein
MMRERIASNENLRGNTVLIGGGARIGKQLKAGGAFYRSIEQRARTALEREKTKIHV